MRPVVRADDAESRADRPSELQVVNDAAHGTWLEVAARALAIAAIPTRTELRRR
jgi:hypothetical protein